MDIVLVRHGRTELNERGCFAGSLDVGLSDRGRKEIKRLKEYLQGIDFDVIYSSPLIRAVETAQILGYRYIIDERIREIHFGQFEGLSYSEIEEKYPEECKKWNEDNFNYQFPDGENLDDVLIRTLDFMSSLDKNKKRILIITHGGVIRCILSEIFKSREYFYRFKIEHGTANILSYDSHLMYIKGINCISNIKELIDNA